MTHEPWNKAQYSTAAPHLTHQQKLETEQTHLNVHPVTVLCAKRIGARPLGSE